MNLARDMERQTLNNTDEPVNIIQTVRGKGGETEDAEAGNNICSRLLLGSKRANLIKALPCFPVFFPLSFSTWTITVIDHS